MRKIKYLILVIMILLFTGCSGNYNLIFNKDLSINEELNILIDNTNDEMYERTYQLFEEANIDKEKYNMVVVDDKVQIIYKEKYDSFEDYYLNSSIYKTLFRDIEFTKDNTGMIIDASSKFKLNDKEYQNIINSYDIDNLNINIKIPFSVNKNNAEKVNDNVYTWTLNKNDTYKKISLDFSYKNDRAQNLVVLVVMGIISLLIIGFIIVNLIKNKRI